MDDLMSTNNTTAETLQEEKEGKCLSDDPKFFKDLDLNDLSIVITQILLEIIMENQNQSISCNDDCFFSKKIPAMSIQDYLRRIIKYSKLEPATLITTVIYIDRICEREKYVLNFNNIHRTLLAAVLVSVKFHEDDFYKNTQYAKIGGISLEEINSLEQEFCKLLNFAFFVSEPEFQKYKCYFTKLFEAET